MCQPIGSGMPIVPPIRLKVSRGLIGFVGWIKDSSNGRLGSRWRQSWPATVGAETARSRQQHRSTALAGAEAEAALRGNDVAATDDDDDDEGDEEEEEEETRATSSFNTITTTGTRRQHVFRHSDTFNHFDPPDEMDPSLAALLPPMMSHTNSEMTMGSVNSEVMMGNVSSEVTMSSVNSFNMGRMASLHSMDNLAPMPQANSMPNLNNNNNNNNMMAGGGSDSMGNFVIQANSMPNLPMMATVPSMSHPMSNMTGVPCTNGTMTGMNNMGSFNNMNTQVSYNMTPCPGMPMSIPIATADKSDHTVTLTPPPHPPVDSQGSTQPPSMISTSSLSIPMMDPNSGSEGALDSDNSPRVGRTPSTGTPPEGVPKTTLMLRNLPRCYTQSLLVTLLENEGFTPEYDFLYLPVDFKSHSALGYAFINAVDEESALRMYKHFNNFTKWGVPSNKKCSVGWSYKSMGLDANVQRYRNSPVMHPSVPTHYQPIRRLNGKLIPFEEPTKTIKPPRQGTQLVLP
mmetsp:Transcript_86469/g.181049  ORF Transcript_86469/g.181049 Transcript_86469/m.181049 type:complete len:514 (-) Transcript_86469:175-1716(-)